MPRQRPRRRRKRGSSTEADSAANAAVRLEPAAEPSGRRWLPSAGIVAAMGLGIWLGWTFTSIGGSVEQIALWVGVLMAGLGGGRLFRRSLQSRRDRRR